MIRTSVLCFALLGACASGAVAQGAPASGATVLRAWSDANPLPQASEMRQDLDRERILGCWAPGPTMARDRLRRFDTEVAKLPQGNPERASYERLRPTFLQAAEAEAKAPSKAIPAPKDLAEALGRAEAWLDKNEPAGMKAFRASADAKDAAKASRAAFEASLAGQHSAALAALIAAHRLAPKNADVLVNLAGALSHFRMNQEALVVLAAAEKLPLGEGVLGWPVKATLLNNQGYALIGLGRFTEAETALRTASQLAPNLAEAQQNLARTLTCQGKTNEALIAARRGVRRTAAETAKPGTPVPPEAVVETPQPEPDEDAPKETFRPSEFVFDVSRGKSFNLPNLKLPQTPVEAVQLLPSYKKLLEELRAQDDAMSERQQELQQVIRGRQEPTRLVQQRRDLLLRAIYRADDAPRIKPLWRAHAKSRAAVSDIWTNFWHCEGGCTISNIMKQASASSDYDKTFRDLCVPALSGANNSWRGAMHAQATDLAKAAEATYRLSTGLAANYSDPSWHELASLQAEKGALAAFTNLVYDAMIWAQDVEKFQDKCVPQATVTPPVKVAEDIKFDRTASCKDLFGTAALKASFKIVEISVACETVSLKLSTPGWLAAFGKVEKNFVNDAVTVAAGAELGVTIPGTALGAKGAMGMYVTLDGQGEFKDVGTLAEAGATLGLKIDEGGKAGLGAKVGGKWSLLNSVGSP
ncbi:tetratricopeptide repeat protein [Deinococcus yavapaiensis]|uniref:Uncharacterized protein n=1 Tax=Deinococcus yavapaiensis KR-236 TaxID=694435 RepID=A0A318S3Y5_9DEIO|nr:tetratricopeptide repeat protein [Deinococcus yavapaiensis]PYE51079.1 hypothetical protein DES52_1158 [Deinococcus yavapaiensis KR-236]